MVNPRKKMGKSKPHGRGKNLNLLKTGYKISIKDYSTIPTEFNS
jgi:hypothetical protein